MSAAGMTNLTFLEEEEANFTMLEDFEVLMWYDIIVEYFEVLIWYNILSKYFEIFIWYDIISD